MQKAHVLAETGAICERCLGQGQTTALNKIVRGPASTQFRVILGHTSKMKMERESPNMEGKARISLKTLRNKGQELDGEYAYQVVTMTTICHKSMVYFSYRKVCFFVNFVKERKM